MISGKVFTSLLGGVAAGTILGILFAPEKGAESRKKINKKGDQLIDEMRKKFKDFNQEVSQQYRSAEKKVRQQADEKLS